MLRDLGHEKVAVLDGGLAHWPEELMDSAEVVATPVEYHGRPGVMAQVDRAELAASGAGFVLLDARADDRYRGEVEPVDPVAGHIPSAHSAPLTDNLDPDGRFKSPEDLAGHYAAMGVSAAVDAVVYCGSGVTACHNILAMEVAGIGAATLYPGSWSDWSTAGMPVAVGPDPGRWPA
jgi:thiosulfate/3-mercaptopyruvate sulfurtransferase